MHIGVATCLNKGSETSKEKILRILKKGNIGMANMHKKQRRQDRDSLVIMAR